METIAFIGLGNMGGQMVRHLLAAGYQIRGYARRAEVVAQYAALGVTMVDSPQAAAHSADVVMLNVTSTADVESVMLGAHGVIRGARADTIICDFSTIDAAKTRDMAVQLSRWQIHLLDCPVSGGVRAAETATLSMMVGGLAEHLARVRPMLEKLAAHIFHMGDVGAGQVAKACNQIVQVVAIQGIAEAMRYANANNADPARVVEALMAGFAGSKMLGLMGPKMAARDFAAGIEARLHHKDFGLVAQSAAQQQLDLPAVRLVHAQLEKLMAEGWGNMDTSCLLRVLELGAGDKR